MSARAAARAVSIPLSWVDLPTVPHPQYISSNGYELVAPEVEVGVEGIAGDGDQAMFDVLQGEAKIEDGEEAVVNTEEEQGEPLLSMADSLVLVQSLHQSRQRHAQRLLPHIFTHPPLPSHSKPRARGPPRSTFLYPTPPTLLPPLPYREYHGPRPKSGNPSAPEPSPVDSPKADEVKGSTARTQARAKRAAELDEIAPAHETECIARVTLSIGPFSYPETELWIGRFVEPRADAGKAIKAEKRAKMLAAGVEPVKNKIPAVPRPSVTTTASTSKPAPAQSANVRPPPSTAGPSVRPTPTPSTPAVPSAAKPESAINPELIRKVNLAAATRPWLSEIIHKAARKQATKEELSRLGRTVGRLNKGEDIDQEGETVSAAVLPPSTGPPASASGTGAAAAGPSRTSSPLTSEDDSDSELSDPDEVASRKGPPQVGGGPLKGTTKKDVSPEVVKREVNTAEEGSSETKTSAQPTSPRVPTPFTHFTPKPVVPQPRPPKSSIPQRPPTKTPPVSAQQPSRPTAPAPIIPLKTTEAQHGPEASPSTNMLPPPPPRPLYPSVPPFLFIAFKDALTEKFLLPLGANSVITRIGGDHVTHPTPPPIPVASAPTPTESTVPPTPDPVAPAEASLTAVEKAKLRSRASIGRNAKETVIPPPELKAVTPIPPEPEIPILVDTVPENKKITPKRDEKPGTVVVSMLMPTGEWEKPDWDQLEKGLPWVKVVPKQSVDLPTVSSTATNDPGPEVSPSDQLPGSSAQNPTTASKPPAAILNLASVDFTPSEGDLRPVTIRLSGIDDAAWMRVKQIMEVVERAEVDVILREEPDLVRSKCADALAASPAPGANGKTPDIERSVVPIAPTSSALIQNARSIYLDRKQSRITRLLRRAPSRTFLRLRTETVDPALIESTTDKWAPRPYPMSTKPLYTRSPPPEDYTDPLPFAHYPSPERTGNNKKKKGDDTGVTFEMPVSLDKLDEMVEEGAKFAVGKKGAKRVRVKAEKGEEDGRKKRRSIAGAICEGCGLPGLKVWRRGPRGKGTLCKDCGDAFVAGTLGELKAPGAGKKAAPVTEMEGHEAVVTEEGRAKEPAESEAVKPATPPPGSVGIAEEKAGAPVPAESAPSAEPLETASSSKPPMMVEQADGETRMDVDIA